MNTLLLFLAIPIATIILSIVLLKILKCPILVAATFFAIYLILTYAVFGTDFLIFVIVYTILSYITAVLTKLICNIIERFNRCCNNRKEGNNLPCFCNQNEEYSGIYNNNNCGNVNGNTVRTANQTRFTLTTNQPNPVFYLTNRGNGGARRNNCCCGRR